METNYTIRAADGKEYGPVTLGELTSWVREGRVNQDTEIRRSDMEYWAKASGFTELQALFVAVPPPLASAGAPVTGVSSDDPQAAARLRSGASWFYWVAGLSLINSVVALTGSNWRLIFGLGVTQLIAELGTNFGGAAVAVTFVLNLIATGVFVLFGVFAHKRHLWAFIAGGVLFLLDLVFLLLVQDWISVAFHAWVLFSFFMGAKACHELNSR
ncbi:MAG: hypothetical protein RLY20_1924 [Verrucomicrobiota bacterium]|jgi:hypothetical protein